MELKVKYLVPDMKPITSAHNGEWIDLRAAKDYVLVPGDYRKIGLGVAIELPEGYEAIVAPRSSTFEKWGIIMTPSIGVIDNLYKGDEDEWTFPAFALKHAKIHKNDRICQFRIIKMQPEFSLKAVTHLGNVNRGGLGSTGKD